MHTKHVMIDIETLSTEGDAAIVAIGAVEFDLSHILQQRLWFINPAFASGRRDVSTLEWWTNQSPKTASMVMSGVERENVIAAELFNWLTPFNVFRESRQREREDSHWIWAGPTTFDLSILKTWYRNQGMLLPWNFRCERDLTTLSRVADQLGVDYSGEAFDGFEAHNPLSDCIKQARRCQIILKTLNRRNGIYLQEEPTPYIHSADR